MEHDLTKKAVKDFAEMIHAGRLGVAGEECVWHKSKPTPVLTTVEEIYEYGVSLYDADLSVLQLNAVVAILLAAKRDEHTDIMDKCLDRLISSSQSLGCIRYLIQKKYIRYGVDELRYIYDKYTIEEVFTMVALEARTMWLSYSWDSLLKWFNGTIQYNQTKFVSSFFNVRTQDAYKKWLLREAKNSGYPDLRMGSLQLYVKIRKYSKYEVTLSKYTCQELFQFCQNNGIKTTYNQIACMLQAFHYEVPEPENKPLHERPEWKAAHRSELLFWKQTKADKMEEEEVRVTLNQIQQKMRFSNEEMACLYNWINIARYEGRANSILPAIPESLDRKYRVKDTDTEIAICRRVRKDIVNTFGKDYNRVINVFSRNLGGRTSINKTELAL